MDKFIPYGRQNIDQDDIDAVVEVLKSPLITQGPDVDEFERCIADYCGARFAVAFNSGTSALHASMYAAGVGMGDEVITSPITFLASANAAVYMGAKPVFVDMDIDSYCIDISKIEQAITSKTKAIVAVDYAGYPVDIQKIKAIADKYNLLIIEDAAHALGAMRKGTLVGTEADMTMFSFHPVKHITTGEGGIIVTNNHDYYYKLRQFRNHGIVKDKFHLFENHGPWYYEMQDLGYNYRLTSIQAALGISQLNKLEDFIAERNKIVNRYNETFKDCTMLEVPPRVEDGRHVYHLYPVMLSAEINRQHFFEYMRSNNIGVQVHYIPVHLQPYYKNSFNYKQGDFPVAEDFYHREISLPVFPGLTEEEQDYVIEKVKNFV